MGEQPELIVADAAAWRAWLDAHHGSHDGVWLTLAKKGTTEPTTLRYDEALDEALCYGWIDGQARSGADGTHGTYRQRFTPRRPRSVWSQRNVGIVARLEAEGRIQPAGRAEVDRAKADGRWDRAYGGIDEVPDDLAAALAAEPRAEALFAILIRSNRNHILHDVAAAVRPDTRARRIAKYVAMLARAETPFPQRSRLPDA